MKTPRRAFVVEYRQSKRQSHAKPSSIWGNLDLRAMARQVETDGNAAKAETVADGFGADRSTIAQISTLAPAADSLAKRGGEALGGTKVSLSADAVVTAREIAALKKKRVSLSASNAKQSSPMAEGTMIEASATAIPPTAAPVEKKRKPPATTEPAEAKTNDATEKPVKKTRVKRNSNQTPVRAEKPVAAKKAGAPPVRAAAHVLVGTTVSITDDTVELIELEEENRQLRKALSEKLRAENADLRKRLGRI